jgi:hypothetical protein
MYLGRGFVLPAGDEGAAGYGAGCHEGLAAVARRTGLRHKIEAPQGMAVAARGSGVGGRPHYARQSLRNFVFL